MSLETRAPHESDVQDPLPSRKEAAVFRAKTAVFQLREIFFGGPRKRWNAEKVRDGWLCLADVRSRLEATNLGRAEFGLNSGKIQNLRVAAGILDGVVIPAGEVFSFWAQVPRPTRGHGFVKGRELREGCLVPSVGGGLCQLSNALFEAAMDAGLEIVERHAHSKKVPGSRADENRDATVFWNYVDLKFRSEFDWQLTVGLNRDELIVKVLAAHATKSATNRSSESSAPPQQIPEPVPEVRSCESCGMTSCFRNPRAVSDSASFQAQTAFLVDAFWPEFGQWIEGNCTEHDTLLMPLSQNHWLSRFGGRYPWPVGGFRNVIDFPAFTLRRSIGSRRLANQGAARQRAMLNYSRDLALRMGQRIPHQADRVVVSLDLLPHLWKNGTLGGRQFDVLMTRWPICEIQRKLDEAAKRWPESPTLADFRADDELAQTESEALAAADRWIAPHPGIAAHSCGNVELLEWDLPAQSDLTGAGKGRDRLLFPAATAGRNGAWELRAACRQLEIPITLIGTNVEGADFWKGVTTQTTDGVSWLPGDVGAVVLPAWIATQPRKLLQARAAGTPVISTAEAGISHLSGVTTVPTGDVDSLAEALRETLGL